MTPCRFLWYPLSPVPLQIPPGGGGLQGLAGGAGPLLQPGQDARGVGGRGGPPAGHRHAEGGRPGRRLRPDGQGGWVSRSVGQSVSQSMCESVSQSGSQSIVQMVSQSISQ